MTQVANDQARKLYKLAGTQRVRMLTIDESKGLNVVLKGAGKAARWLHDPTLTMDEITDDQINEITVPNFTQTLAESVRKQRVQYQQQAHEKESAMKTASTGRKAKRIAIDGRDHDDNEYRGLSMCQIIRFAGSKGADKHQARAIVEKAGFEPAEGTITIQLGKGRKLEAVPNVSDELAAELLGDLLPPPADKATKGDKKMKKVRTAEEIAARKAKKAARRAKAHRTAGHEVKA